MRYFFGLHYQGTGLEWLEGLRREIAEKTGTSAALRFPPHITIFSPFDLPDDYDWTDLDNKIATLCRHYPPLATAVTGFSPFDEQVWFLDFDQTAGLKNLSREVVAVMKSTTGLEERNFGGKERYFHLTLAYKDLTPPVFHQIAGMLQTREIPLKTLEFQGLTLFLHLQDHWVPQKFFPFSGSALGQSPE
jgi:2'-5' RNA ligase